MADEERSSPRPAKRGEVGGRRPPGEGSDAATICGPLSLTLSPLRGARANGFNDPGALSRRASVFLAAALLALASAAVAKSPPAKATAAAKAPADIDALLAGLAKAPGLYAHFREEKHITLLQQPLVSEGSIYFAPPSRFARHTEKPLKSVLILDGHQLQFGSADGQESMNLASSPVARLFADAFVMLLSGNRAGLEKIFKMQLTPKAGGAAGAAGDWKLVLTPRVAPMDKLIKEMELRGQGLGLSELDVREANGDWTRTSFTSVDLNRRYTAADQAKFFKLPGK